MEKIDLTYAGKIKTLINILNEKELDILYTIDGKTGLATTTSIKINNSLMITFDYQKLKKIIEGAD